MPSTGRFEGPTRTGASIGGWMALLVAVAVNGGGCDAGRPEPAPYFPNPYGAEPGAIERGCVLYVENCADCHGKTGHGDGRHQEHLNPQPTDLMSRASRERGNLYYYDRVAQGGEPPSGMPAFAELLDDQEIWETIAFVSQLFNGHAAECASVDDGVADDGDDHSATDDADDHAADDGGAGDDAADGPDDDGPDDDGPADDGPADDGGSTSDGGTAGDDGGPSPACTMLCGCLDAHCTSVSGYPFASQDACQTACAGWSTAELDCWQGFCSEIEQSPGLADHLCEHAWGGLGLNEC